MSASPLDRGLGTLAAALIRWRLPLLAVFALITLALGFSATHLQVDARFEKSIPRQHEFMRAFLKYEPTFGGANTVVVALINKDGDIFNKPFLDRLHAVTDDVFFIKGVKRESVTSLWTPRVRYVEVTEKGFAGGSVIRSGFAGTKDDIAAVRANTEKSGEIGRLVSNDLHGALVTFELQDEASASAAGSKPLDYEQVAQQLEALRGKYAGAGISLHIIGFAKVVGDIGEGTRGVLLFFAGAAALTTVLLRLYTRSWALTWRALIVALLPVLWLLGVMPLIGMGIDPMSILVPYLLFTIGVSHAVQMTGAWSRAVQAGASPQEAAQQSFIALFLPGTLALLTNAIGFLVIMLVDIDMVRELGVMASVGVSLMILTNKLLLPVVLSFGKAAHAPSARNTKPAAQASRDASATPNWLSLAATPQVALPIVALAVLLGLFGAIKGEQVHIGDTGQGMPEFFADARYNRDAQAILQAFSLGSEVLSVYVLPPAQGQSRDKTQDKQICLRPEVADYVDALDAHLRDTPGVANVIAYPHYAAMINAGWNEGNIKWQVVSDSAAAMGQAANQLITDGAGLVAPNCEAMQLMVFAADHDAHTISTLVQAVNAFSQKHPNAPAALVLGGGNLGVMAATNEAVARAEPRMLAAIFGSLAVLCLLTFRDITSVIVIILPLALVSVLCNATMAMLGIGLKVSTLPVVTLGVGVGVDYGIYLYERLKHHLHHPHDGLELPTAWARAVEERGWPVLFTATTMSLGVGSWAFSALKFQADMGLLLAFMFIVNVIGALLLMPALMALLFKLGMFKHPGAKRAAQAV